MGSRASANIALGIAVRQLRHELSISQEELAERASVHRTYVGGIERGERNPSLQNLLRIARALEVTPSELMVRFERAAGTDT